MGGLGNFLKSVHQSVGAILGNDLNTIADPVGAELQTQQDVKDLQSKISSLNPLAAAAPTPVDTSPTPIATSDDLRLAARKSLADQLARKGRQSTILTNQDSLGASG